MTRYCGQCGTVLGVSSLRSGRCSNCGAQIEPSEETYDVQAMVLAEDQTQAMVRPVPPPSPEESTAELAGVEDGAYGGDHAANPRERYIWLPRKSSQQGTQALFWTLALLSSAAVLVAAIGLFFLTQRGALTAILTPFSSASPSGASGAPGAASATAGSGPHARATASPSGAGATATPSGAGTATATPTSGPPPTTFSVSPTSISIALCSGSIYKIYNFTISNTGGAPLYWTVTASVKGYSVTPSAGTLGSGLHVKVYLSGILQSGVVTIYSRNATNSPQQLDIKCAS